MTAARISTLRLAGVTRSFGGHQALRGLDLEISGGEFVALLGPSGCGKSTALNCLAGLLPLTGGQIFLDGERIDQLAPERRGFGMVFQNYALFPHMTVRNNVGFGLKMAKVPRAEAAERVTRALDMVQLTAHAHKRPGQLSGGQQQRVAIARAIVLEPRLVLMDEPLSNLDAALRLEMRAEIRRLHQRLGLTTVYVTHDQEEALSLADRLVVLRDGRTQQIGTPEEVYSRPANRYVASFMGYRTLLDATVTGTRGPHVVVDIAGSPLVGLDRDGVAAGGRVTAAIRPEDLDAVTVDEPADGTSSSGTSGTPGLPATVEVVEYHGRELAVQARLTDGRRVHFRTRKRLAPDESVRLVAPSDRVLVFVAADGDGQPSDSGTGPSRGPGGAGAGDGPAAPGPSAPEPSAPEAGEEDSAGPRSPAAAPADEGAAEPSEKSREARDTPKQVAT
ncbi:ABC transporter ATP-binding protein [Streptomyces sp. 6-11-2]|uniref:ABC transporter ATP-binding protein n=1 Tax=Streptomyces sp. 6-11-2 TaxID=2585753 RepID=UPI001166543D|nr:ABC transporter ATP-binding protein [Streptomyces sp. 6-11-2]GED84411.1 ABC transporter ATP-binding protein [Streptomyces sp. 6-11-2]